MSLARLAEKLVGPSRGKGSVRKVSTLFALNVFVSSCMGKVRVKYGLGIGQGVIFRAKNVSAKSLNSVGVVGFVFHGLLLFSLVVPLFEISSRFFEDIWLRKKN